MMHYESI